MTVKGWRLAAAAWLLACSAAGVWAGRVLVEIGAVGAPCGPREALEAPAVGGHGRRK